ncbi:MAG: class I SAM-dependent methyltransferase [Okeania sp. SIO2C2]|uniref:class I SAM-dependent DNA methyltransferase n=1 Tax=Okeania sp. SIO2C2 TaxID=2607787 RepID=UPI0013B7F988|nr:class I SAM-dependent methyltransferase [Okeania sp. SIO2C2]NEP88397.1 class I SAM-dependent methyltransferase [Okeania sp. SIO2C2]
MSQEPQSISSAWANNPPVNASKVEADYDFLADDYDDLIKQWAYEGPRIGVELAKQFFSLEDLILDAGCGTGLTGEFLYNQGFTNIIGVDISQKSLDKAVQRQVYRELVKANLQEPLSWPDNTFDATYCIGVLTYFPNHFPLQEFCRVTRPGGWVIFSQRVDLFEDGGHGTEYNSMESQGLWQQKYISQPIAYLPGHSEYAQKILVYYLAYQVTQ